VLGTVKNVMSVKSTKSAVNFLGHLLLQAVSIIHLGMRVNQRKVLPVILVHFRDLPWWKKKNRERERERERERGAGPNI